MICINLFASVNICLIQYSSLTLKIKGATILISGILRLDLRIFCSFKEENNRQKIGGDDGEYRRSCSWSDRRAGPDDY